MTRFGGIADILECVGEPYGGIADTVKGVVQCSDNIGEYIGHTWVAPPSVSPTLPKVLADSTWGVSRYPQRCRRQTQVIADTSRHFRRVADIHNTRRF